MTTPKIEKIEASAYRIPTEAPESDGTLQWDSTTIVIAEVHGGGKTGLGYTYTHAVAAELIREKLAGAVIGMDAMAVPAVWNSMSEALRNIGRPGLGLMAISAMDCALWDLKARLLNLPLVSLLGQQRDGVPVYGSGGFTSYDDQKLTDQLAGWVAQGIPRVKMKVGRDPASDPARVKAARRAIGESPELFVDANGAYGRKEALRMAWLFREEFGVGWFEEPSSSEDLEGLRFLRDRGPGGLDIAAGEYGWDVQWGNKGAITKKSEDGETPTIQGDEDHVENAERVRRGEGFKKSRRKSEEDDFRTPRTPRSAYGKDVATVTEKGK